MLHNYIFIINFVLSNQKTIIMKSLLFFFFLGFGTIIAQENGLRKTYIQEGKLIKFSEYYENGQLAQTGFLLDGKNHGVWQSFDINGAKKSKGVFFKGNKVDRWFFWNNGQLLEVDYKNNEVQSAIKWGDAKLIASKDD